MGGEICNRPTQDVTEVFQQENPPRKPEPSGKSTMPAERVVPGSTAFTVIRVPFVLTANPREIASCAVLVMS